MLAHSFLIESSSKLRNQDRHKSSDEFVFVSLVSMAHLYVFLFALIAEKTTSDLGTLDSGERLLPFGLLVVNTGSLASDLRSR